MNGSTAFDSDRLRDAYPPGIERSWWHIARNRIIARAFQRHVPRDAQVLEVGCGTGIVTDALRARGWNVTGVDLARPAAEADARTYLMHGTDALTWPARLRSSFDVLALFDVIEHVADAPAFLRSLLIAYPNVHQLLVTVPARAELWTSFDDHYGHFRRYDRPMLREELTDAGLIIDQVAYFFHSLYPAIGLNNLVRGRQRAIRFQAPRSTASLALNKALGNLFAVENAVLPRALTGSSLIAVAHRRSTSPE